MTEPQQNTVSEKVRNFSIAACKEGGCSMGSSVRGEGSCKQGMWSYSLQTMPKAPDTQDTWGLSRK
jgi:hypothetical protein